jgi:L-seryl-tRNA(Ser) seleniumtransferase
MVPMDDRRRLLPRTDAVLADARLIAVEQRLGHARVRRAVAEALDGLRSGEIPDVTDAEAVATAALRALPGAATSMRRVINATGVVVHTNLGRAPLSAAAIDALVAAAGYVDVEYDVQSGGRAQRGRAALAALQRAVPDAAGVHVANNGAAALLLAIATLAAGREVIISRGEMIEIGDGFRLPDLVAAAGGRIREVGTTNRTTLDDYAAARSDQTGCILKVHPSNYRIEGFTRTVEVRDLVQLGVPVVADVGSGLLAPEAALPEEPDVRSALRAGAAVVICSGDKLLGGPQAGLIFGDADVVTRMRRHPLARAVRVDKLALAALEATLDGPATPTDQALHADADALRARCERVGRAIGDLVPSDVVAVAGAVGGGGAPGVPLPGWAIALPDSFAQRLRAGDPPVIGRVERGRCLLDLRCVPESDEAAVVGAVRAAASDVQG